MASAYKIEPEPKAERKMESFKAEADPEPKAFSKPKQNYDSEILIIGCGSSSLSEDMYQYAGLENITNIDFSENLINYLNSNQNSVDHNQQK